MGWIGAARTKSFGYALLGIRVMVDMEIGLEELEFWKSLKNLSLSSHGLEWKMVIDTVKFS